MHIADLDHLKMFNKLKLMEWVLAHYSNHQFYSNYHFYSNRHCLGVTPKCFLNRRIKKLQFS